MTFFYYYNLIAAFIGVLILIYIKKLTFQQIEPFINLYLIFKTLFLFLYAICFWEKTPIAFFWFLLIPFFYMSIYSQRSTIYWIVYILALILLTIVFSHYIESLPIYKHIVVFPPKGIILINVFALFSVLCLFALISFFGKKIQLLSLQNSLPQSLPSIIHNFENDEDVDNFFNKENIENDEKLKMLYSEILEFFQENEPFKRADFSIIHLANALSTNVTYISRSIKFNANTNFITFVNNYRINFVKELINNNELKKHTLLYLYTSAGFKHQSTFNKVFKQIEGVTPTKYLKEKGEKNPIKQQD
jgi:AraC-like DNA-binding protein